ncbi:ATP-binding protein [Caldimonas brevitalea]|uniref:Virulence sensor protein BvgS n=1 Tax=Caldimonas brevitalea TaxID=413882 RepID=A0A0G3BLK1_9BURK|nr:ATP-binding protein [Caldimonas brevitalea]AKJ30314.1 diguanylate cyclase [Caldimonas brevitalea]
MERRDQPDASRGELHVADELARRMQARMFWLAATLTLVASLLFLSFFLIKGPARLAWMDAATLLVVGALAWHVRVSNRPDQGMAGIALTLCVALSHKMWLQGGLSAPTLWWMIVLPWLWMLAGSIRGGLLLGALVGGVFVFMWGAERNGWLPPPLLSSAPRLHHLVSMGGSLLLYGVFVGFSLKLRSDLQRELRHTLSELQRSRDEAWWASQVKANFLSNISHELRTPINGILGATELLRGTRLDARQQQLVSMQRQSLDSLMALVNDVLDYTRLEGGGLQLEPVPISPRALVFDALDLFAGAAHEKGLELTCSAMPEVPVTVLGDPTRLRQVLGHLISNAVKFTPYGGVHVHLAVDGSHGPRGPGEVMRLRIEVRDTGIGIDPAQLPRLFGAFAQADASGSRRVGGAGLGLALCRELAELMGGEIQAESAPGQGSCFTLSVPLQVSGEPAEPALPPLAPTRLLLVANQHRLVQHVESLLRGSAVAVELKALPPTAAELQSARDLGIGAVLLDERLLGSCGRERLEQMVSEAGLPVLLMQALSRDSTHVALDGVFVLSKPVRPRALYEGVQWAAHLRRNAGPEAPAPARAATAILLTGRVLLVEDNPVNQVMTQAMLERLGLQVVIAGDGQEALRRYAEQSFDVVLMDVQMPGMDGLEATQRLRQAEAQRKAVRTPIVAVSGNPEPDIRERGRAAGMDDFLGKPFTLEQLEHVLLRWHTGRPAAPAAATETEPPNPTGPPAPAVARVTPG